MGLMDKKDNTKNAEYVNTVYYLNRQLCLIVIHIGLCCEVIQGPYMLCSFDVTCTSLLITLCVIKLKETSTLQYRLYKQLWIFV